jgi:Fic family protein
MDNQTVIDLFEYFDAHFSSEIHDIKIRSVVVIVTDKTCFELHTNRGIYRWVLKKGVLVGIDGVKDFNVNPEFLTKHEPNTKLVIDRINANSTYVFSVEVLNLKNTVYSKIESQQLKAKPFSIGVAKIEAQPNLKTINFDKIVESVYESNRIEGSKLTIDETKGAIDNVEDVSETDVSKLEAKNLYLATLMIIEQAKLTKPADISLLRNLHGVLLKDINNANNGLFRRGSVYIKGAQAKFPAPELVESLISQMFDEYKGLIEDDTHPIARAAFLHNRFVGIHPFIDGNGRTARLLMNFELIRCGYNPIVISADKERDVYYKIVDEVNVTQEYQQLVEFLIDKNVTVNVTVNSVVDLMRQNPQITVDEIAETLSRNRRTILRWLKPLQNNGIICRVGSDKTGYWQVRDAE